MSYGIVRIQKFKADAVRGIEIHDSREKQSRTNPDIKPEKTAENYSLIEEKQGYREKIQANIDKLNLKRAVRKDAVVMCQAMVTSDNSFFKNMPEQDEREFFKKALSFLKQRYGNENIISATVHKDERTPHLHVNFTPITHGKLSAKALLTRQHLSDLQTTFHQQVGQKFGLQRGETREEKSKHLSVQEFKKQTLKKLNDDINKKEKELNLIKNSKEELKILKEQIKKYKKYPEKIKSDNLELKKKFSSFNPLKYKQNLILLSHTINEISDEKEKLKKDLRKKIFYIDQLEKENKEIKEKNKFYSKELETVSKIINESKILKNMNIKEKLKNKEFNFQNIWKIIKTETQKPKTEETNTKQTHPRPMRMR